MCKLNSRRRNVLIAICCLALIVVAIIVIHWSVLSPDTRESVADDFLSALYAVQLDDYEKILSLSSETPSEGNLPDEHVDGLLEHFLEKYEIFLTDDCFDRMISNRVFVEPLNNAYEAGCNVAIDKITFIGESELSDGDRYVMDYTVSTIYQEPSSADVIGGQTIELQLTVQKRNSSWVISSFKLISMEDNPK